MTNVLKACIDDTNKLGNLAMRLSSMLISPVFWRSCAKDPALLIALISDTVSVGLVRRNTGKHGARRRSNWQTEGAIQSSGQGSNKVY